MDPKVFFNLTIGSFQLPSLELINCDETNKCYGSVDALQRILEIFSMTGRLTIKIAEDGTIGQIVDGKYTTGVLGMMERGEIELCLFPLSIDIPDPPGQFTSVITEEEFIIGSFHRNSERRTQDVTSSLESIDWLTRITIIALIVMLEAFILLLGLIKNSKRDSDQLTTTFTLFKAMERASTTLFSQYFPNRSLIRFSGVLGLFLFTTILNVTMSTDTIVGQREKLPETLSDVVNLNYTPRFFQGESMIELFEQGITADYRRVYSLAKQRKTDVAIELLDDDSFNIPAPGVSILASVRSHRTGSFMSTIFGNPYAKSVYLSAPYHRSLQSLIVNPLNKTFQFNEILNLKIKILFASGISRMLLSKIYDQVMVKSGLGITEFMIFIRDMRTMEKGINFTFEPLSLIGFQVILKFWRYAIVIIIVLEMILSLIHKCKRQ